jgi:hypothetical protein
MKSIVTTKEIQDAAWTKMESKWHEVSGARPLKKEHWL